MPVETLNDIYLQTCRMERPAIMKFKRGEKWIDIRVADFERRVRHFSTGLRGRGVKPGDRVAILSENRPEWAIADFAILALGAVTVPIYSTLLGWQIEFLLNDSGCVAVVASTAEQVKKILEICAHCPSIRTIITCDEELVEPERIVSFDSVIEDGRTIEEEEGRTRFDELLAKVRSQDLATLVYTSGTTGNPKGAMLTHGNITSNVLTTTGIVEFRTGDVALSILPLSHILERMVDFGFYYRGGCVAYAENVANVADNLQEIRPDTFAAVPRLFEKMQAKILDVVADSPAPRQKIFKWAIGVAAERLPYVVERKPMPASISFKSMVADRLVFSKIKEKLGGHIRFIISGGAPLSAELAAFFIGAGVDVLEGYGLTETSPVIAVNTFEARKIGTVGRPIPGVEVKIAADGEILTRGPHVMVGYWNNPEATEKAIDPDGWFHTGDIGELDEEGYLKITDRKKDLIITAYGKNIAPQPLENLLKSSPYVSTPVLIGDRRKYLTALIVPNFEKLERDAKALGLKFASHEELVSHPKIQEIVQKEIDRFNQSLDRQETIRKFTILPEDFSIESGEITPSLKVKRKVVDEKYKQLIDAMYADQSSEKDVQKAG
ncbi:MAG: long-chain fatty acid--CoA ligase [Thermoanaerobaculia bacterium]